MSSKPASGCAPPRPTPRRDREHEYRAGDDEAIRALRCRDLGQGLHRGMAPPRRPGGVRRPLSRAAGTGRAPDPATAADGHRPAGIRRAVRAPAVRSHSRCARRGRAVGRARRDALHRAHAPRHARWPPNQLEGVRPRHAARWPRDRARVLLRPRAADRGRDQKPARVGTVPAPAPARARQPCEDKEKAMTGTSEVRLPQGTIRYREMGTGEPIVLVHGLLTNGELWREVAPRIAADFRVIAPDWPLGSHEIPLNAGADRSPLGLAALIADFMDALQLENVTLVGNDTGGAPCPPRAAHHPPPPARRAASPRAS